MARLLAEGTTETALVLPASQPAVGRSLADVSLRSGPSPGGRAIAVVRGEESFTSPGADFEILEQDTLILVANHRDIDRAISYLKAGE